MSYRTFFAIATVLALLGAACGDRAPAVPDHAATIRTGPWRMELAIPDTASGGTHALPFIFDLVRTGTALRMHIHNGEERITVDEIAVKGDSLHIRMPLYDSEFRCVALNDSTLAGHWHNYLRGPDYRISCFAQAGPAPRFAAGHAGLSVEGQWETHFGTDEVTPAIGLFQQDGHRVTGTFATETGDYRFLDGIVRNDSLLLSSFNGFHAFLFKAGMKNDTLNGRFWSGTHYAEDWVAALNPHFKLRNEDSLTFLKEGHDMVDFHFPSIDGGELSPKDPDHKGHVLLVQVMGSWCPNCVDESRLLSELYDRHHARGLDVIALAFERYPDPKRALQGLIRFREELGVKYPIAYAGFANKDTTSAKLPFLDHIMSYPTCIFIGRDGMVRRIRTGFYGPGTGAERYAAYERDLERFVVGLLNEPPASLASAKE
ncbi:MAG: TlpA disulfide reductase family protein [Flavobacteriales bacterium]|nr:TlpA family protein disulfide reductase [Flavobacteriales bacterium]